MNIPTLLDTNSSNRPLAIDEAVHSKHASFGKLRFDVDPQDHRKKKA